VCALPFEFLLKKEPIVISLLCVCDLKKNYDFDKLKDIDVSK